MHSGVFQLTRHSRNTWCFSKADHPDNSNGTGNPYCRSGKRPTRIYSSCPKECYLNGTTELGEMQLYNARSCIKLINYRWGSSHLKLDKEEEEAGELSI